MRVRIRDDQNICRRDDSDGSNTIIAATPVLTSPNGGEVWKVNSVRRTSPGQHGYSAHIGVLIEFSADNGVIMEHSDYNGCTEHWYAMLGPYRFTPLHHRL
jgi:hypothetical protein